MPLTIPVESATDDSSRPSTSTTPGGSTNPEMATPNAENHQLDLPKSALTDVSPTDQERPVMEPRLPREPVFVDINDALV